MKISLALFLLLAFTSCHTIFYTGTYKGSSFTYTLNSDSSFVYTFNQHMIGDESTGIYSFNKKKVYFTYSADTLSARPARPIYVVIKKKRLYPVLNDSIGINKKWVLRLQR